MNNYKLTIQYDGGRYKGWQRLGNTENTIQGKIEKVLTEMAGEEIEIIGSGRTDAGAHALAQIANFKMRKRMTEEEVMKYLNRYLPQDISVVNVALVQDRFHARYNAKDKTYSYKIWNKPFPNPFMRKYSMHVEEKLDQKKMKEAAKHFLGSMTLRPIPMPRGRKSPWCVKSTHSILKKKKASLKLRSAVMGSFTIW